MDHDRPETSRRWAIIGSLQSNNEHHVTRLKKDGSEAHFPQEEPCIEFHLFHACTDSYILVLKPASQPEEEKGEGRGDELPVPMYSNPVLGDWLL